MKPRYIIYTAAVVLGILHQDFWYWNDRSLVLGFLPIGLAYHILFSIAAATLWTMAVRFAWPSEVEEFASRTDKE